MRYVNILTFIIANFIGHFLFFQVAYRGARKGRGLVVAPKDYSTKYRYWFSVRRGQMDRNALVEKAGSEWKFMYDC